MIVCRSCLFALALLVSACGTTPSATDGAATAPDDPGTASPTAVPPTAVAPTAVAATATPTPAAPPIPTLIVEEAEAVLPMPTKAPTAEPRAIAKPESGCLRLTDFEVEAENAAWFVVNDNVMGGQSNGGPSFGDSAVIFEGDINTNGGGFSSIRVQLTPDAFAGYSRLRVRARTDGRPYKVMLQDGAETQGRRVSHQAPLVFEGDGASDWQTAEINFAELNPRIFGRDVESETFRPDLANQLGIMLSDGVDGPFRIEIDWIDICA